MVTRSMVTVMAPPIRSSAFIWSDFAATVSEMSTLYLLIVDEFRLAIPEHPRREMERLRLGVPAGPDAGRAALGEPVEQSAILVATGAPRGGLDFVDGDVVRGRALGGDDHGARVAVHVRADDAVGVEG